MSTLPLPWGPLPPGLVRWAAGPLTVWLTPSESEWRIAWSRGSDPLAAAAQVDVDPDPPPTDAEELRLATSAAAPLTATPRLADRAVVVRPDVPLRVVDRAVLFVSTPLWLSLSVGDGPGLLELPTWQPSDTWFGATPTEGQLAYSSRTRARTLAGELAPSLARAVTRVEIHNSASDPMPVYRINLPVPALDLYAADGGLWTTSVLLERKPDRETGSLELVPGPPAEHPDAGRIGVARHPAPQGMLARALSALIG